MSQILTATPTGAVRIRRGSTSIRPNSEVMAVKPRGQWNRFLLRVKGDRLTVSLNGSAVMKEVHLGSAAPARGLFALFGEGGPVEFANVFVQVVYEPADAHAYDVRGYLACGAQIRRGTQG